MSIRLLSSALALTFCSISVAQDIFVSRTGSDKLDGSSATINLSNKTGPFKTLKKAQQAIRDLKASGKLSEAITVHIGEGTFQLKAPLEFDANDSGEPGKEILWQGEKGSTLLTGGLLLSDCQQYDSENPDQILSCPLDSSLTDTISTDDNSRTSRNGPAFEVFVNDYRMQPARYPDYGWLYIKYPLTDRTRFSVYQKIPSFSGDISNAQVRIFPGNDYYDQYIDIETLDHTNNQITLASESAYDLAEGRRFYMQNAKEFLTTSSEWFYDKQNSELLFIPPYGLNPKSVVISSTKNLIKLSNASYIGFRNINFEHSTGSAITAENSNNLTFEELDISNIGSKGIFATENNTNIYIANNSIHDTAFGAISLSGGDRPTLQSSGNIIFNNKIYNYSTNLITYGIYIFGVAGHVHHNLLAQASSGGIFFSGNEHMIERNEIYSICQISNDCGAIYSGRDWTYRGNIIQYNYIHDLYGYGLTSVDIPNNIIRYTYEGARGVYLDDGLSGTKVFGNLLVNAGSMSIQLGNGRDTLIENNIIKTNKKGMWVALYSDFYNWDWNRESLATMPINSDLWKNKYPLLTKPMAHDTWPEGNTIQRNVIISTAYLGYSLRYQLPVESNIIAQNLVWHATSDIRTDYKLLDTGVTKGGALWDDWVSQGLEKNSIKADPCLNIAGKKVTLTCSDSPLLQLGIIGLPSDMGLVK